MKSVKHEILNGTEHQVFTTVAHIPPGIRHGISFRIGTGLIIEQRVRFTIMRAAQEKQ